MFDGVSPYYRVITINNDGWAKVEGSDAPGNILWINLNLIKVSLRRRGGARTL